MKLNSEQRHALIGKTFVQDRKFPTQSITIYDIERCAGGFTVKYTMGDGFGMRYLGLHAFLKRYKHELMEVGE